MPEFDFAILGAGAIGSILGANLARAGHRVVMLARGTRAAFLEQHGLVIRGLAEFTAAVSTLRDPRALRAAGTLIVATKTPGTAAALEPLRRAQLDVAGVRAAATPEIRTLEWSKFCGWVGLMALSVTTRAHTWRFLSDPDAALLVTRLVRETGALARALGIGLSDRAVLPAATLCGAAESDAVALVMRIGDEYRRNVPTHRMSALQDVEAGRPLEVHETLGYACEKARELELDLPLLAAFTRLIAAIDRMR